MAMNKTPKIRPAARALIAGLVMLGLAACQPAAAVPGGGGIDTGGSSGANPTTTAAPTARLPR